MSLLEFSERINERTLEHEGNDEPSSFLPPSKKIRIDGHGEDKSASATDDNTMGPVSIESLLRVPMNIIFRKINEKPLLTRAEGHCFLRITMLAQEMDGSIEVAETALRQRRHSRRMSQKLEDTRSPILRPLAMLMRLHGEQSSPAINAVEKTLAATMIELQSCSSNLRQMSEQNWSVAESLADTMGGALAGHVGRLLAREKYSLAEMEDEVAKRIDSIIAMASVNYPEERRRMKLGEGRDLFGKQGGDNVWSEPMEHVCSRLFGNRAPEKSVAQSTRPYIQPDDHRNSARSSQRSAQEMDLDGGDSTQPEMEESQNSFRKRSTAAATLANLAAKSDLN